MAKNKKRKGNAAVDEHMSYSKRARHHAAPGLDDAGTTPQPRVDATTGLRSAFPGLDGDDGGELFYGPANDGLDYLRMVR